MVNLHNKKGIIAGQIQKNLGGEDIALIGNNISQTTGTAWQTLIKFRDTRQSFPAVYGYALNLHDAFQKEPYAIELSESEARGKLRAWGYSAVDADKLINTNLEVE